MQWKDMRCETCGHLARYHNNAPGTNRDPCYYGSPGRGYRYKGRPWCKCEDMKCEGYRL